MAWQGSEKLAISSSDGYITFVTFDKGFLGQRVKEVPDDIKHFYEAMDKANYDDLLKEAPQVTFKNATFKSKMGPTQSVTKEVASKDKSPKKEMVVETPMQVDTTS